MAYKPKILELLAGGTNAALVASNGGILYSSASAVGILSGTATAGQIIRSGASTTPTWSTATYPATAGTTGNLLTSDGTNFISSAPAANLLITTYDSDNTWTMNSRTKMVEFYMWGGGGGGGSGRCGASASAGGGAGGCGGDFLHIKYNATDLPSSPYTVTIGTGGTGGSLVNATTTNGNPGNPGNNTSVGTIVSAGGNGGGGGTNATINNGNGSYSGEGINFASSLASSSAGGGQGSNALGGTGGPASAVYCYCTGGGGGSGYTAATPRTGGAGGTIINSAGTSLVVGGLAGANTGATAGDGNSPSGLTFTVGATGGGGGGHDGTITAGTGGNGAQPGGGGGGGAGNLNLNNSGGGGTGVKGRVIIIEYF